MYLQQAPVLKQEVVRPPPHASVVRPPSQASVVRPPATSAEVHVVSHSFGQPPAKKIARVQPTPHVVRPIPQKLTSVPSPRLQEIEKKFLIADISVTSITVRHNNNCFDNK
jgi:hypothetical protein